MISKKSSQVSETNKIIQEELDEYLNPPPKGLQYSNGSGGGDPVRTFCSKMKINPILFGTLFALSKFYTIFAAWNYKTH